MDVEFRARRAMRVRTTSRVITRVDCRVNCRGMQSKEGQYLGEHRERLTAQLLPGNYQELTRRNPL